MNYYIDFDNTLFNTPEITSRMIATISKAIIRHHGTGLTERLRLATSKINNNDKLKKELDSFGEGYGYNFTKETIDKISKLTKKERIEHKSNSDTEVQDDMLQKVIYFMSKKYETDGYNLQDILDGKITFKKEHIHEIYYNECRATFNREHIYNIYELISYFSKIYELKEQTLKALVEAVILNSTDLVYPDSEPFLDALKEKENNLYLWTYCKESLRYQSCKVSGSGLSDKFNFLYIAQNPKDTIDITFKNSIFIDDRPKELLKIWEKVKDNVPEGLKLIRLRRPNGKYSDIELPEELKNSGIVEEFESLDEIFFHLYPDEEKKNEDNER